MPRNRPTECRKKGSGGHSHTGKISWGGLCKACVAGSRRANEAGAFGKRTTRNRRRGSSKRKAGAASSGNKTTGALKKKAGRNGGRSGRGASKARTGTQNGRCALLLNNPTTWKPIDVSVDVFEQLLVVLHKGRETKKTSPWLRRGLLPAAVRNSDAEDLDKVIQTVHGRNCANQVNHRRASVRSGRICKVGPSVNRVSLHPFLSCCP